MQFNLGFESQRDRLLWLSGAIEDIAKESATPIRISELLNVSAKRCRLLPAQMKYALSYADTEGLVSIDFDNATVSHQA